MGDRDLCFFLRHLPWECAAVFVCGYLGRVFCLLLLPAAQSVGTDTAPYRSQLLVRDPDPAGGRRCNAPARVYTAVGHGGGGGDLSVLHRCFLQKAVIYKAMDL